jgi:hypothetical protein
LEALQRDAVQWGWNDPDPIRRRSALDLEIEAFEALTPQEQTELYHRDRERYLRIMEARRDRATAKLLATNP